MEYQQPRGDDMKKFSFRIVLKNEIGKLIDYREVSTVPEIKPSLVGLVDSWPEFAVGDTITIERITHD